MSAEITLNIKLSPDVDDGYIRLDPMDMRVLGIQTGDVLRLEGRRTTYARALPTLMEDRNQRLAVAPALLVNNMKAMDGEKIQVTTAAGAMPYAESLMLIADDDLDRLHLSVQMRHLTSLWAHRVVTVGDKLLLPTRDRQPLTVEVACPRGQGPFQIGSGTLFTVSVRDEKKDYLTLGGVRDVYRTCCDIAKSRLLAEQDTAARSILLTGPAGCGKSRLVVRLGQETDVPIEVFDAHQMLDRWLIQGPYELDVTLTSYARRGPTILLLDHLDALTIVQEASGALVAAQRGVLALLFGLLDEMPMHKNLLLAAVASGPIDPRFQAQQRFDLILPVDAPDRLARQEILSLATRHIPLQDDVDLPRLAAMTAGATARDLCQLVTSASVATQEPKVASADFVTALRAASFSAATEVRCDIPTTSWDDVAGLDDIKQLMRETLLWSLRYQDKFAAAGVTPPRSILLSGGEGTGKTSLVRALGAYMPVNFIEIACSPLAALGPIAAVRMIRESFVMARRKSPCLIFFDDLDVLFEIAATVSPDGEQAYLHPIVAQLGAGLDSLSFLPGVVVIAATNRPDRLTTEILRPGRLDFAVTLPLPDLAARKKILEIHAHKLPLSGDVNFDYLAQATQGLSPAEIANLCGRVGLLALRQSLSSPDGGVMPAVASAALFEQCLRGRKV